MTEFKGIAYEPHPVTPERKAELRAQGLRIIDIAFQPVDGDPIAFKPAGASAAAPRATRRGKSEE